MNSTTFIKLIQKLVKKHNKKIFRLKELALLSHETDASVGMALLRAQKNGLVERVGNLWFNRMDPPSLMALGLELRSPSYVSFESALYHHGILSQSPKGQLTVATTERPAILSTPLGEIRFLHLSKKFFFGFDKERMATPEKAVLDLIYMRCRKGTLPLSEVFYWDLLNKQILLSLTKKFPSYVKKRLLEYL